MNNMKTLSEQKLLSSAQKGDNQSFEELLLINFRKSKPIIQRRFKLSNQNLEDIMQNTSLKIWQHIGKYNDKSFYNWFFTIFKNEAIRFLKLRNIIEANEFTGLIMNSEDGNNPKEEVSINSLDLVLQDTARTFLEKKEEIKEYQQIIDALFLKLSPNHKEIIQMVLIDDKTYEEASSLLKIPKGSVMSRLYYAKKEAQKHIQSYIEKEKIEFTTI